jgi:hypothetical protein
VCLSEKEKSKMTEESINKKTPLLGICKYDSWGDSDRSVTFHFFEDGTMRRYKQESSYSFGGGGGGGGSETKTFAGTFRVKLVEGKPHLEVKEDDKYRSKSSSGSNAGYSQSDDMMTRDKPLEPYLIDVEKLLDGSLNGKEYNYPSKGTVNISEGSAEKFMAFVRAKIVQSSTTAAAATEFA